MTELEKISNGVKRPILYIVIPFCLGITLARFFKIPISYSVTASFVFIALALLKSSKNILSHASLYLAVFFFGLACYQNSIRLAADHISCYAQDEPQTVLIKGIVSDDPITSPALYGKKKTVFVVRAKGLGLLRPFGARNDGDYNWHSASGLVKVSAYSEREIPVSFGDELLLEGLLSKPHGLKNPGVFDYEEYLAIKDIHAVLSVKNWDRHLFLTGPNSHLENRCLSLIKNIWRYVQKTAYNLRHYLRNLFDKYLQPPCSGFMKAILIGDRTGLDENLKDDFIKTGTVHILAISGLHVGLIAALVLAFFGILKIPKKTNFILTLLFLIFYSFAAGSNPPIIRAAIMFGIIVIGYLINREADTLNSLSLAAFLILLSNPKELFDPSFQLSFTSVASIIIFVPRINELFSIEFEIKPGSFFRKIIMYVFEGIVVSMAAWLGTWPIILSYFNIVSPISIIANLIVIPLLFVLMTASSVFILASFTTHFLANIAAGCVKTIEYILFTSNHFLSKIQFSHLRAATPPLGFLALYYTAVSLFLFPHVIEVGRVRVKRSAILLLLLLCFNIVVWSGVATFRKETLKMTFLDVGQGDSIFIELPRGGSVLIDGGPGGEEGKYDTGRSIVAPYLWSKGVRSIDAVILTHFHSDHLGGLIYVLKNFKVGCVIDSGVAIRNSAMYGEYREILRDRKIRYIAVEEGDVIRIANGVKFFVLNPPKEADKHGSLSTENDDSVALKLVYNNFSAMLCGDITAKTMSRLMRHDSMLKSDVMKVPHHGGHLGKEEIVMNFFSKVSPRICVTSAGKMYRYDSSHGKPTLTTCLNSASYNTKDDGAITLLVDSKSSYSVTLY